MSLFSEAAPPAAPRPRARIAKAVATPQPVARPAVIEFVANAAYLRIGGTEKVWKLDLVRTGITKGAMKDLAASFSPWGSRSTAPMVEPFAVDASQVDPAAVSEAGQPAARGMAEAGLITPDEQEFFFGKGDLVGILRMRRREDGGWSASVSKSSLPRVLSADAVERGLMPPEGVSALPASLEKIVPEEYQFWTRKGEEARTMRDALVDSGFLTEDNIRPVDGELRKVEVRFFLYDPAGDAAEKGVAAKLLKQVPPQARVTCNPFDAGATWREKMAESDVAGTVLLLSPPSEDIGVRELVDAAALLKADWIIDVTDTPEAREILCHVAPTFKLAGEPDRVFATSFAAADPTQVRWVTTKAPATPAAATVSKCVVVGKAGEERYVLGIVLEPDVVDAQNDTYSADEVRRAEQVFMEQYRHTGLMHREKVDDVVKILESYLAPVDFDLSGTAVKKGTWLMAVHVLDDELWKQVKAGGLTGFSIGGSAVRTPTKTN